MRENYHSLLLRLCVGKQITKLRLTLSMKYGAVSFFRMPNCITKEVTYNRSCYKETI